MRILTVNVGSTSIKLRVIGDGDEIEGRTDLPAPSHLAPGQLSQAMERLGPVDAVGHRIVHGGLEFRQPVLVDDHVLGRLRALSDLAPLHQPPALDALDAVRAETPGVPTLACFDTAFHATLPVEAYTYAIPPRWRDLGARRFGFHGLSHAWASRRAAELVPLHENARVVTCHLGGGASLAAVAGGRCVDTTMGFSPLEGLVMATRSGSVDPGLILWLEQHHGMAADDIAQDLEHRSGLLGLCGADNMVDVITRAAGATPSGDDPPGGGGTSGGDGPGGGVPGEDGPGGDRPGGDRLAAIALGVYVHRLRAAIAAMVAALGGLDALVFTGGVGENSPAVREAACAGLGFLGVALDCDANPVATPDEDISQPDSAVRLLIVEAREDLEIAKGVRAALSVDMG